MSDAIDTSAEAVERLAQRLIYRVEHEAAATLRALLAERDRWYVEAELQRIANITLTAERDAALVEAARLREAHAENARLLGLLVNDLQGRIEGGKLAALHQCWERAALAKEAGDV